MKIFWFSPLPPAKTDIANYTARIAPMLREAADVTFIEQGGGHLGNQFTTLRGASLSPRQVNQADLCVYQIGNNPDFHGEILEAACRFPGLIILHDRAILEFLLIHCARRTERTGSFIDSRPWEELAKWYGADGIAAARLLNQGSVHPAQLAAHFPLFEVAINRALGVVCHNPLVTEEVQSRFPKLPALSLPLPYSAPRTRPARPDRRAGQTIKLMMFGFMAANRRATEFLHCWRMSPHWERFELHLAGELSERSRFDDVAAELGLADRIHHHGFLDADRLDQMIRNADLALNLRNPTMGEASGSQLRIWANGCPVVVSDTGWFGTLPDDCVHKISPQAEREELLLLLADLAQGRLDLEGLAERGFAELRQHDPDQYVQRLVAWIEANRSEMADAWTETALMTAVAEAYADSLPIELDISLPPHLLS